MRVSGSWVGSDRKSRLPADWEKRRQARLRHDQSKCVWVHQGKRCGWKATDVDHVVPGDDHGFDNLRSLCSWHHGKKSGSEGGRAAAKQRAENRGKFRIVEKHPGLL